MELANDDASCVSHDGVTYGPVPPSTHVFDIPPEVGEHLLSFPYLGWRWPTPEDWVGGEETAVPVVVASLPAAKPDSVEGRRAPLSPAPGGGSIPEPEADDDTAVAVLDEGVGVVPDEALETFGREAIEEIAGTPVVSVSEALADLDADPAVTDVTVDERGSDDAPAPTSPEDPATVEPAAEPQTLADRLVSDALAAGPDGITSACAVEAHGKKAYDELAALVKAGQLVKPGRGRFVHPDHAADAAK